MNITDELLYAHAGEARDVWLNSLPSAGEIPSHTFSRRFERNMRLLLRRRCRAPWVNQALRTGKTAAAVLLIAITVTFSTLMTVEAYREKVIEIVSRVFTEFTEFKFHTGEETGELPDVSFGYLPEGMEETVSETYDGYRYILYENGTGKLFELNQLLLGAGDANTMNLDTEDTVSESFYIKGEDAVMHTKNGDTNVLWTCRNVIYHLYGNLPPEEMKTIAENIN